MAPPKKFAKERIVTTELSYINPYTRDNPFEIYLRHDGIHAAIATKTSLGLYHRAGYSRLMMDDIEILQGDQLLPIEKDYGTYWCEPDENGFAIIIPTTGEPHYILGIDSAVREKFLANQRRFFEAKNTNVVDAEVGAANRGLARGASFEADQEEHEETVKI